MKINLSSKNWRSNEWPRLRTIGSRSASNQYQYHCHTQEPRFPRTRFQANFLCFIFGEEVWNDGKRHVLEFGIIRHTILFEGAKLCKIGSTDYEGLLKLHSGPKENTLPAPSLDQVLNRQFEEQKGWWKYGETSLGTKPKGGVSTVMSVPPKRGLSHPFQPGSYCLAPYEEYTSGNSYWTSLKPT